MQVTYRKIESNNLITHKIEKRQAAHEAFANLQSAIQEQETLPARAARVALASPQWAEWLARSINTLLASDRGATGNLEALVAYAESCADPEQRRLKDLGELTDPLRWLVKKITAECRKAGCPVVRVPGGREMKPEGYRKIEYGETVTRCDECTNSVRAKNSNRLFCDLFKSYISRWKTCNMAEKKRPERIKMPETSQKKPKKTRIARLPVSGLTAIKRAAERKTSAVESYRSLQAAREIERLKNRITDLEIERDEAVDNAAYWTSRAKIYKGALEASGAKIR